MENGTRTSKRKAVREFTEPTGFDVTCVVGRVEFDTMGEHTPYEAALLVIGQYGGEGSYTFPSEDGNTVRVTIERELSPYNPIHEKTHEVESF